ncbi:type II toxin-antitoxin system RelE/ParE family toxin [Paraherbaspirillum soli]|uniref:Type II toxin-antitoxin system RelE/ParE family toxin n=1 Tax=Paraherbaspirillum soli TaxID=631222 RepID=A0ABW0MAQ6_9BURK
MTKKIAVKLTAHFEKNLDRIEQFLTAADAPQAFGALLDGLMEKVIPNLERFPEMGPSFIKRPARSVEANNGLAALRNKLGQGELHEYLMADYLILYARYEDVVYLLSIRHHRELSFDFQALWPPA